jgi:sulfite reductase (NADPH) flavoprotein alpha-component
MNALTPIIPASATMPVIPDNAPFSAPQRAWLNGFLAGLYSAAAASGGAV